MQFNPAGLKLLRDFEQCRLEAYDDATGKTVAKGDAVRGRLTIGWGHTGPDVVAGLVWTQEQADRALDQKLAEVEAGVAQALGVFGRALTDNQFSALVCFAYNVGLGAFATSSPLRLARDGRLADVPANLRLWSKVRGSTGVLVPSAGLMRRRLAECDLWERPDGPQ